MKAFVGISLAQFDPPTLCQLFIDVEGFNPFYSYVNVPIEKGHNLTGIRGTDLVDLAPPPNIVCRHFDAWRAGQPRGKLKVVGWRTHQIMPALVNLFGRKRFNRHVHGNPIDLLSIGQYVATLDRSIRGPGWPRSLSQASLEEYAGCESAMLSRMMGIVNAPICADSARRVWQKFQSLL